MKKFLSIVLALVFVLASATVAFASTNTCPYCHETFKNEREYNDHLADCDGFFRACPYEGCDADFHTIEEYEYHIGVCLEFVGECDYCGAKVRTNNAFNAHVAECKVKYCGIPVHKIFKMIMGVDYDNIIDKVLGFIEGINMNDIFVKVFELAEKGVHLGVDKLKA